MTEGYLKEAARRAGIPTEAQVRQGAAIHGVYVPPEPDDVLFSVGSPPRRPRIVGRGLWLVFAIVGAVCFWTTLWVVAARSEPVDPWPDTSVRSTWAKQATAFCAGPWVEYARTTETSRMPYYVWVTVQVQCVRDARISPAYTFNGDPL